MLEFGSPTALELMGQMALGAGPVLLWNIACVMAWRRKARAKGWDESP